MKPREIARVEAWLRKAFNNAAVRISLSKLSASPELWVSGEFLGTVHRDDEDGEISYSINIVVLEEDLS